MPTSKTIKEYLNLPWTYRFEWWDDNGGYYAAYVEEIKGCVSDGQTLEEAMANLREALALHIEGLMERNSPIPEPVRLSDYKGSIAYRTKPEKHYRLAREAQRRGVSINRLIDEAVDDKLVG